MAEEQKTGCSYRLIVRAVPMQVNAEANRRV